MNGDTEQTSGPTANKDQRGGSAFLPVGIVFAVFAVAMAVIGNPAWIAFATMGATFLILGFRGRMKKQPTDTPLD